MASCPWIRKRRKWKSGFGFKSEANIVKNHRSCVIIFYFLVLFKAQKPRVFRWLHTDEGWAATSVHLFPPLHWCVTVCSKQNRKHLIHVGVNFCFCAFWILTLVKCSSTPPPAILSQIFFTLSLCGIEKDWVAQFSCGWAASERSAAVKATAPRGFGRSLLACVNTPLSFRFVVYFHSNLSIKVPPPPFSSLSSLHLPLLPSQ